MGIAKEYLHVWRNWTQRAVSNFEKRGPLAQLSVSGEITAETRMAAHKTMAAVAGLLKRILANGPMPKAPMGLRYRAHERDGRRNDRSYESGPGPCEEALQDGL